MLKLQAFFFFLTQKQNNDDALGMDTKTTTLLSSEKGFRKIKNSTYQIEYGLMIYPLEVVREIRFFFNLNTTEVDDDVGTVKL